MGGAFSELSGGVVCCKWFSWARADQGYLKEKKWGGGGLLLQLSASLLHGPKILYQEI